MYVRIWNLLGQQELNYSAERINRNGWIFELLVFIVSFCLCVCDPFFKYAHVYHLQQTHPHVQVYTDLHSERDLR